MGGQVPAAKLPTGDPGGLAETLVVLQSDALSVRAGLARLMASAPFRQLSEDRRGLAEVLVAEVLNNIVEHAYARHSGEISVAVRLDSAALHLTIEDEGLAMPGGEPPPGRLPEIGAFDDLPEGGFGWHLIRTHVSDLRYARQGGRNRLDFRISVNDPG